MHLSIMYRSVMYRYVLTQLKNIPISIHCFYSEGESKQYPLASIAMHSHISLKSSASLCLCMEKRAALITFLSLSGLRMTAPRGNVQTDSGHTHTRIDEGFRGQMPQEGLETPTDPFPKCHLTYFHPWIILRTTLCYVVFSHTLCYFVRSS